MALSTGKIAEVMFEKTLEMYEQQDQLLTLTDFHQPDAGSMQNGGNFTWYPVQQHAPIISGWDISGHETGIIEETYPALLGTPNNDFVQMRADDLRDTRFWERRGSESGRRQATELNKDIVEAISTQGSLFYRSNVTSGYEFIAEAQAIMNERQQKDTGRSFILNDRDTLTFASDLAGRQTLQGKPDKAWATSQIGQNVAGFNVYTGSYLPNIIGNADPAVDIDNDQSFAPTAGTVNAVTGVVTNIDYREAILTVDAGHELLLSVGDKITIENSGTAVQSIGLADKVATGQAMTFTVIDVSTSTELKVYPKPIAVGDPALSTLELAYANINTQILNNATVTQLNTDTTNKCNIFFDRAAIEVIGGTIPAELFKQYDGMKVITTTMKNGLNLYMVYDGNISTMNFRFRLFTWYGITICNPSACGVAVTY